MRPLATALALTISLALPVAASAEADEPGEFADGLSVAAEALKDGEFARAVELAGDLARAAGAARPPDVEEDEPSELPRQDRAEAWRIFGLALFFHGDLDEAETALLEFLKLEQDARLDPALVPPEAIVFVEDVRSRHADEIRSYHPDPEQRRWALLNLAPPAGQFQNDHRRKGFFVAASGVALIGLNLGTYWQLSRWCGADNTCGEEDSRYREARILRTLTMASLIGVGAVYVFGVVDGFAGFRGGGRDVSLSLAPGGGAGVAITGRF